MPRLLLVDDNPSIHKIAETLLAPTSIELVCLESGPEAISRIEAGERFDVALVDAAMGGMDGWELLAWMRKHPGTAGIPIALMAGVLDSVDPVRLENAPIQGFLKKPVELRDLGDRVKRLLETPVPEPAPVPVEAPAPSGISPFATLPAVKLKDLPEMRGIAAPEPVVEPAPEPEPSDLLELEEADLLPEPDDTELAVLPEPEVEAESLDLEELDLDGLKGLNLEAGPEFAEPLPIGHELPPELPTAEALPEVQVPEDALTVHPEDLPDLGEEDATPSIELTQAAAPESVPDFDWADESESLLDLSEPLPESNQEPEPEPEAEPEPESEPMPEPEPEFEAEPEPVPPLAEPIPAPESAAQTVAPAALGQDVRGLVEALKADPAALRLLAKALVTELGTDVLKEVAWELMPEMAERLGRH